MAIEIDLPDEIEEDVETMAMIGRNLINQYIGWCRRYGRPDGLRGWASFCQCEIEFFINECEVHDNEEEAQNGNTS